jgi:hypothetical protein
LELREEHEIDAVVRPRSSGGKSVKSLRVSKRDRLFSIMARLSGGSNGNVRESADPIPAWKRNATYEPLGALSSAPTSPRSFYPHGQFGELQDARGSVASFESSRNDRKKRKSFGSVMGKKMRMSGKGRKKLVVSGLGDSDVGGFEAVKAWCEVGFFLFLFLSSWDSLDSSRTGLWGSTSDITKIKRKS